MMRQIPVILYAEDDPDDRELLRESLADRNVEVDMVEAVNGRDALNYLRSENSITRRPSLILLDLNMPVLNGRETLAIIKNDSRLKTIPIVVFTTSSSPLDETYCRKFSVEMITKPSSPGELDRVMARILEYCSGGRR